MNTYYHIGEERFFVTRKIIHEKHRISSCFFVPIFAKSMQFPSYLYIIIHYKVSIKFLVHDRVMHQINGVHPNDINYDRTEKLNTVPGSRFKDSRE